MESIKKIIYLFVFFLISCDPVDNRFVLINKSNQTIFGLIEDTLFSKDYVWITTLGDTLIESNYFDYIKPNDSFHISQIGVGNAWKETVERNFPDSTICLFIFDSLIVDKFKCSKVLTEKDAIKIYKLHISELERMNWHIVFDDK